MPDPATLFSALQADLSCKHLPVHHSGHGALAAATLMTAAHSLQGTAAATRTSTMAAGPSVVALTGPAAASTVVTSNAARLGPVAAASNCANTASTSLSARSDGRLMTALCVGGAVALVGAGAGYYWYMRWYAASSGQGRAGCGSGGRSELTVVDQADGMQQQKKKKMSGAAARGKPVPNEATAAVPGVACQQTIGAAASTGTAADASSPSSGVWLVRRGRSVEPGAAGQRDSHKLHQRQHWRAASSSSASTIASPTSSSSSSAATAITVPNSLVWSIQAAVPHPSSMSPVPPRGAAARGDAALTTAANTNSSFVVTRQGSRVVAPMPAGHYGQRVKMIDHADASSDYGQYTLRPRLQSGTVERLPSSQSLAQINSAEGDAGGAAAETKRGNGALPTGHADAANGDAADGGNDGEDDDFPDSATSVSRPLSFSAISLISSAATGNSGSGSGSRSVSRGQWIENSRGRNRSRGYRADRGMRHGASGSVAARMTGTAFQRPCSATAAGASTGGGFTAWLASTLRAGAPKVLAAYLLGPTADEGDGTDCADAAGDADVTSAGAAPTGPSVDVDTGDVFNTHPHPPPQQPPCTVVDVGVAYPSPTRQALPRTAIGRRRSSLVAGAATTTTTDAGAHTLDQSKRTAPVSIRRSGTLASSVALPTISGAAGAAEGCRHGDGAAAPARTTLSHHATGGAEAAASSRLRQRRNSAPARESTASASPQSSLGINRNTSSILEGYRALTTQELRKVQNLAAIATALLHSARGSGGSGGSAVFSPRLASAPSSSTAHAEQMCVPQQPSPLPSTTATGRRFNITARSSSSSSSSSSSAAAVRVRGRPTTGSRAGLQKKAASARSASSTWTSGRSSPASASNGGGSSSATPGSSSGSSSASYGMRARHQSVPHQHSSASSRAGFGTGQHHRKAACAQKLTNATPGASRDAAAPSDGIGSTVITTSSQQQRLQQERLVGLEREMMWAAHKVRTSMDGTANDVTGETASIAAEYAAVPRRSLPPPPWLSTLGCTGNAPSTPTQMQQQPTQPTTAAPAAGSAIARVTSPASNSQLKVVRPTVAAMVAAVAAAASPARGAARSITTMAARRPRQLSSSSTMPSMHPNVDVTSPTRPARAVAAAPAITTTTTTPAKQLTLAQQRVMHQQLGAPPSRTNQFHTPSLMVLPQSPVQDRAPQPQLRFWSPTASSTGKAAAAGTGTGTGTVSLHRLQLTRGRTFSSSSSSGDGMAFCSPATAPIMSSTQRHAVPRLPLSPLPVTSTQVSRSAVTYHHHLHSSSIGSADTGVMSTSSMVGAGGADAAIDGTVPNDKVGSLPWKTGHSRSTSLNNSTSSTTTSTTTPHHRSGSNTTTNPNSIPITGMERHLRRMRLAQGRRADERAADMAAEEARSPPPIFYGGHGHLPGASHATTCSSGTSSPSPSHAQVRSTKHFASPPRTMLPAPRSTGGQQQSTTSMTRHYALPTASYAASISKASSSAVAGTAIDEAHDEGLAVDD